MSTVVDILIVPTVVYTWSKLLKAILLIEWLRKLRDPTAKARIKMRIRRLSLGNAGDVQPIGEGLSEMRIDYGPGYRVYYMQRSKVLVLLLCGGDKRTQQKDIDSAKRIAAEWND
jgi:putative addiction module killer protein